MIWLDFFLQVLVHALAWCLALVIVFGPTALAVLVVFHSWRRRTRAPKAWRRGR